MTEQKPTKNVSQAGHDEKGRFAKGNKISKGRSVGSRNKATLLAQAQMADRLPESHRKVAPKRSGRGIRRH